MAKDLLLEIGLEEVPARFVRGAINQLKEKAEKWLQEARVSYASIEGYATPRRLAILVSGVAEKQTDVSEEVKGPSRKIALDAEGNWSKAALGFARSQGTEPDALYFKELAGVEYVYVNKSSVGVETSAVLSEGLAALALSLAFPKNMRWGSNELKYVRPIRWLVALFGEEVVPLEIAGVHSGRVSRGHRFLGAEATIGEPAEYVEKLREQFVIVSPLEREREITAQIEALAADRGWVVAVKEDLLEEVLFLVEYPTALFGQFDPAFLEIPQEVLITSMREHQRYFPVLDQEGNLQPYFVTVRNGDSTSIDQVARGNEKVLRARLSDAKFFYSEDHKLSIDAALGKLESVTYHAELGSIADKARRVKAIADELAIQLGATPEQQAKISRTAQICKFDLVTQMVYEFPELQGTMGEDYARRAGEDSEVARAIFEHYQPRFAGDQAPASLIGAVVSLADKLDTIVGCFSIGIIPTGSQDPYGLRRQAAGIVQIVLAHQLLLPLKELFAVAIRVHEARGMKRSAADVQQDLQEFVALRVRNVLSEQGVRYDVIDAIMATGFDELPKAIARASAIFAAATGDGRESFKLAVDAFNRVCNLAQKATADEVDKQKFADEAEGVLYEAWLAAHKAVDELLAEGNAALAIERLSALREPITAYFDQVMVMAEDEGIRANRLAMLRGIANDIYKLADFSKLVL